MNSPAIIEVLVTGLNVVDMQGAIFFPPIGTLARVMSPLDSVLARLNAPGAALLVMAADKQENRW